MTFENRMAQWIFSTQERERLVHLLEYEFWLDDDAINNLSSLRRDLNETYRKSAA